MGVENSIFFRAAEAGVRFPKPGAYIESMLAGVDQLWYGKHPYAHHVWAGISLADPHTSRWGYYVRTAQNHQSAGSSSHADTIEECVSQILARYPTAKPIYTRPGFDFGNQIVQDTLF